MSVLRFSLLSIYSSRSTSVMSDVASSAPSRPASFSLDAYLPRPLFSSRTETSAYAKDGGEDQVRGTGQEQRVRPCFYEVTRTGQAELTELLDQPASPSA